MLAKDGEITKKEILSRMERSPHYAEGEAQFTTSMSNLVSIRVVNRNQMEGLRYTLNDTFSNKLV
jgi:UTP-glucose-1-phosphate uridylyltransferase